MYSEIYYGVLLYSQDIPLPSDEQIEWLTPDLMSYLPAYMKDAQIMTELQVAQAREIGRLNARRLDLLDQCFIDTSTWGLILWESELGIDTDLSKSYEARREVAKAKRRGTGTVTKQMLKNMVLVYTSSDVQIIEDPANHTFILKFIGVLGVPANMAGLVETLNAIKPAHLSYSFQYTWTWWNQLKEETWVQLATGTWDDLKTYKE